MDSNHRRYNRQIYNLISLPLENSPVESLDMVWDGMHTLRPIQTHSGYSQCVYNVIHNDGSYRVPYTQRIDRTRTDYLTADMPCRKRRVKPLFQWFSSHRMLCQWATTLHSFNQKIWGFCNLCWSSFVGDSATPKGCAGVEPATTQRVSPRLLPSALVYTTEFHPNGHDKTRTCIPGSWCTKHNSLDDFRLLYDITILIYELEGDTELVAERRQQTYSSSYIFVYTALKAGTTHQSGCLSNYRLLLPYAQLITGIFVVFFFKYTKAYLLISTCL